MTKTAERTAVETADVPPIPAPPRAGDRRRRRLADQARAYGFLLGGLICFALFSWYPAIRAVVIAFQKYTPGSPPEWVGTANFTRVWPDPEFAAAWRNTLTFTLLALLIGFAIPFVLALVLNELRHAKAFFRVVVYLPVMIPPVVSALLWKWFYDPGTGLADERLRALHLPTSNWSNGADTALISLVIVATWANMGGTVLSVSVTSKGADPSGNGDSTQAFRDAISAAQGGVVWIPPGDYRLSSSLSGVQNVTLQGAGSWYSVVHTSRFIDQSSSSGGVHIKDFAVMGEVTERVDSNPDNFVNGALGPNSSVSGMWIQHLKVGLWLMGDNDNLVVENNRILDTTADGLNLNGNARGVRVRNNFLRNQGDDSLAMWSLYSPDTGSSFENNTISQPNLANGIAIYGGTDIAVRNNLVSDTNALGSGIAISNQKFLDPFSPLAGTITVDGNTLVRTGDEPQLEPSHGRVAGRLLRQRRQRHREHHQHHHHRQPLQRLRVRVGRRTGPPGQERHRGRRDRAQHRDRGRPGRGPGRGHLPPRHGDGRRRHRRLQLPLPGEFRHLHPHRRRRQLRLEQHLVGLLQLAAARRREPGPRPGPQPRQGPPGHGHRLPGRLHARQGRRRRREQLLGVHRQRLPAVLDGRPRCLLRGPAPGAEAAAVDGVGPAHADHHRARQHRRDRVLDRRRGR